MTASRRTHWSTPVGVALIALGVLIYIALPGCAAKTPFPERAFAVEVRCIDSDGHEQHYIRVSNDPWKASLGRGQ